MIRCIIAKNIAEENTAAIFFVAFRSLSYCRGELCSTVVTLIVLLPSAGAWGILNFALRNKFRREPYEARIFGV